MNQNGKSIELLQFLLSLKQRIDTILSFYSIAKSKKRTMLAPPSIFHNSNFFLSIFRYYLKSVSPLTKLMICIKWSTPSFLVAINLASAIPCKKNNKELVAAPFVCFYFQLNQAVKGAGLSQSWPKN